MRLIVALFFASCFSVAAQSPEVPHKMQFAGITLTIRDDARREIQKDVDALTQSFKHYNIKAERARMYFPLMEKIFADEQVPDDFKYLALQESALIADAVSTSNAVGFWQFKDFTAIEMGLRVDKEIDERLNIASSTRAAAKYIKKNNTFFDNWIFALQAYQMGAGGVMKSVKDTKGGAKHMEITSNTYWYVKKYLAHKIAYEEGSKGRPQTTVIAYENKNRKTLSDLAKETSADEASLKEFNKWTKSGVIPGDRTYIVTIPVTNAMKDVSLPQLSWLKSQPSNTIKSPVAVVPVKTKINGLVAIQAAEGETAEEFATRAGISLSKFLKYNDISISDKLIKGNYYFIAKKRVRAQEAFYKLAAGENLWSVSQKYGVKLKKLKKYNRLKSGEEPKTGTMLWLASMKPKNEENLGSVADAKPVEEETFNWEVSSLPDKSVVTTTSEAVKITPVIQPQIEVEKNELGDTIQQQNNIKPEVEEIPVQQENVTVNITEVEVIPDEVSANKTEHVVQPKETLYAIAKIYKIGVMDLVNWNNLDLQQGIKPGQILKVKEPKADTKEDLIAKAPREILHEVKASDTLYSIARQYGVTIKDLMDWNGKKDFSLSVGEKLKVAKAQ